RLAGRIELARHFGEQDVAIAPALARFFERRGSARQIGDGRAHAGPLARIGIDQRSVEVEQHETDHLSPPGKVCRIALSRTPVAMSMRLVPAGFGSQRAPSPARGEKVGVRDHWVVSALHPIALSAVGLSRCAGGAQRGHWHVIRRPARLAGDFNLPYAAHRGVPTWEVLMRRFTSFVASALLIGICTLPAVSAENDAVTPVEEFSRQIDQLKNTFTELEKKIEDSAKTIDGMTDVEKARQEIESLRAIVGELLGPVSDNGPVAQLGAKALRHARDKLKSLEQETRFTREEQQYLVGEWRKLVEETERAASDLGMARSEFVGLLRVLQTREDFIDELMQIRRASEAVRVIRQLANDIRAASDALKNLIRAIKPPGV